MVNLSSLIVPILLAAVLVFVASSLIHMLLPYHRSDFKKLPAEDDLMAAVRNAGVEPGDYVMPCANTPAEMRDPKFQERAKHGPAAFVTVFKYDGSMVQSLISWFVYCLVVSVFCAYLATRSIPAGVEYRVVFRFVATVAFLGYAVALWQSSIWYKRPWSTTLKNTFDGLVYSLLTAGAFSFQWPE